MRRGFSLPGVLALTLFLFVLFAALHSALHMNRQRLATVKHRHAAQWLAVSGLDLARVRLAKGEMKVGETIRSPQFPQGRFEVSSRRSGSGVLLVSEGTAAGQRVESRLTVKAP